MNQKTKVFITALLRQNARIKLAVIARKTGMPVSTLFDYVHDPVCLGITRYCALLDFPALGFATRATLFLKAGKDKRDALREHLRKSGSVNSLSRVNNGYDFMADCIFKDLRELEEFCEHLERSYGAKKEVHFVIEELKRETFFADTVVLESSGGAA